MTGYSRYFASALAEAVEHICWIVFSEGRRKKYAKKVLEILLTLVKKTTIPSVDAAWIDDLLKRAAACKQMDDEKFIILLTLSALRRSGEAATGPEITRRRDFDHFEGNEVDPGRTVTWGNPTPECALLDRVLRIVDIYGQQDDWENDAVYGGLIAIKDLPAGRLCDPKEEFIRTLSKAMEERETEGEDRKSVV